MWTHYINHWYIRYHLLTCTSCSLQLIILDLFLCTLYSCTFIHRGIHNSIKKIENTQELFSLSFREALRTRAITLKAGAWFLQSNSMCSLCLMKKDKVLSKSLNAFSIFCVFFLSFHIILFNILMYFYSPVTVTTLLINFLSAIFQWICSQACKSSILKNKFRLEVLIIIVYSNPCRYSCAKEPSNKRWAYIISF